MALERSSTFWPKISTTNSGGLPAYGSMVCVMILQLLNVSCFFGQKEVVHQACLTLHPGEHVALVGGNGSGKSTLLRSVMGLHTRWQGQMFLHQKPIQARRRQCSSGMSWMPQRLARGQFPLSVEELLTAGVPRAAAFSAAEKLGVAHLLRSSLRSLSGGQLQRVYLARALGGASTVQSLLLLDEPTAALDFQGQEDVAALLQALPMSLLVVTHDRVMARKCHRVLEMVDGCLREKYDRLSA